VKLPRVSAAFGRFYLRRGAGLPQVGHRAEAQVYLSAGHLRGVPLDLMLAGFAPDDQTDPDALGER